MVLPAIRRTQIHRRFSVMSRCLQQNVHWHFKGPPCWWETWIVTLRSLPCGSLCNHEVGVIYMHLSAEINNHELEATCQGARHSYILANSIATGMLKTCRIEEAFDFASHPTLYAQLCVQSVIRSELTWCLPSTTDDYSVGTSKLLVTAQNNLERPKGSLEPPQKKMWFVASWWLQISFMFTPKIGEDFQFDSYFFRWVGSTNHQLGRILARLGRSLKKPWARPFELINL